ncbi:cytochrome P450 [Pseudonocardia spinosispora]|uniref:cytochrome P450 n=1 Tax=Pseudonocardia spinosispora TaxID=103441 RepID=UPI0004903138|nr:cytochrome P450 [Pseudonocardia spinosispora]
MTTAVRIPVSDADPFDLTTLADPHPMHAALRDAGPVVHLRRYDIYAMARYEQVHAALVNWQDFQSGAGVGMSNFRLEKPWRPPSLLLEADPPRHDAPRRVLSAILGQRELRRLRERWFADAQQLVDEVVAHDEFDAVEQLTEAFPLRVFPDAVGLPPEDRHHLLPYGNHLFNTFGPANDLVAAGAHAAPEHAAWVNTRCTRDMLTPDGFGARIWAAADRGDITAEQAPLIVRSLLSAGVDTTVHALGAVLHALAVHPEQWRALRERPALARVAFDEAIRWASPVQTFFRTATTDVQIPGSGTVPDGKKILMFLAAANRDPRRWDDPDTYDLTRDPSGHVGFGFGLHQCVGQHVARLEAEALLAALIQRVRTIEMVDDGVRQPNNTLRGWESLPLRIRRT